MHLEKQWDMNFGLESIPVVSALAVDEGEDQANGNDIIFFRKILHIVLAHCLLCKKFVTGIGPSKDCVPRYVH
jgi:hypothetical protein